MCRFVRTEGEEIDIIIHNDNHEGLHVTFFNRIKTRVKMCHNRVKKISTKSANTSTIVMLLYVYMNFM